LFINQVPGGETASFIEHLRGIVPAGVASVFDLRADASPTPPAAPHDLAEAGAFAVHQQVDAKQLRSDPEPAEDGGDQDGHAGDELPRGHADDAEPQHHQHGCGKRNQA